MALTEREEAQVRAIISYMESIAPSFSKDLACRCAALFPEWDGNSHAYCTEDCLCHENELYTCTCDHVSRADCPPPAETSPWIATADAGNEAAMPADVAEVR